MLDKMEFKELHQDLVTANITTKTFDECLKVIWVNRKWMGPKMARLHLPNMRDLCSNNNWWKGHPMRQ